MTAILVITSRSPLLLVWATPISEFPKIGVAQNGCFYKPTGPALLFWCLIRWTPNLETPYGPQINISGKSKEHGSFKQKDCNRAHNVLPISNPMPMLDMALLPIIFTVAHMAPQSKLLIRGLYRGHLGFFFKGLLSCIQGDAAMAQDQNWNSF